SRLPLCVLARPGSGNGLHLCPPVRHAPCAEADASLPMVINSTSSASCPDGKSQPEPYIFHPPGCGQRSRRTPARRRAAAHARNRRELQRAGDDTPSGTAAPRMKSQRMPCITREQLKSASSRLCRAPEGASDGAPLPTLDDEDVGAA